MTVTINGNSGGTAVTDQTGASPMTTGVAQAGTSTTTQTISAAVLDSAVE